MWRAVTMIAAEDGGGGKINSMPKAVARIAFLICVRDMCIVSLAAQLAKQVKIVITRGVRVKGRMYTSASVYWQPTLMTRKMHTRLQVADAISNASRQQRLRD